MQELKSSPHSKSHTPKGGRRSGISSLHWQYLEDVSKITPHTDTPLTLVKKLFVKENTAKGPVLKAAGGASSMEIGDELVVRLELRTDRDIWSMYTSDHEGSGTEPNNVLSRYKWQDGMGYTAHETRLLLLHRFPRKGVRLRIPGTCTT